MIWVFAFVLWGTIVVYAGFISRLLPHPITLLYARVGDVLTSVLGLSLAAGVITAVLWWFARRIFSLDTSAGLIWRLRARSPVNENADERYLVELIEWMAATAGAPRPAVLLFDGPVHNAAVIGDRPEAAAILMSSELWRSLEPAEKEALVADLLATAVNDDLRLNSAIQRGFYMLGIGLTMLDFPFSSNARTTLSSLWRYARQTAQDPAVEIGLTLARTLQPDGLESLTIVVRKLVGEETDLRSLASTLLLVPLLPFFLLRLGAGAISALVSLLLVSPLLALVFRSRRKSADATAVKLTRTPDAVAHALIRVYGSAHAFPAAGRSELNFVAGPETANARVFDRLRARVASAMTTADNFNRRLRSRSTETDLSSPQNLVFGFHPPLTHRIVHLRKLGASLPWSDAPDRSTAIIAAVVSTTLVVVALLVFT